MTELIKKDFDGLTACNISDNFFDIFKGNIDNDCEKIMKNYKEKTREDLGLNNLVYDLILYHNARIHHSKIIKEYIMTQPNIKLCFNIPYTSETNPIEIYFLYLNITLKSQN